MAALDYCGLGDTAEGGGDGGAEDLGSDGEERHGGARQQEIRAGGQRSRPL
jgi:hypothetical protein